MARLDVPHGIQEASFEVGYFDLQIVDELFDPLPFLLLALISGTGRLEYRDALLLDIRFNHPFLHVGQRPDDRLHAVVRQKLRAHGGNGAGIELIQKQGFDEIVEMMTEGDLVAVQPLRHCIEDTTPQPGAKGTPGRFPPPFLHQDLVDGGFFTMEQCSALMEIFTDCPGGKARKTGIDDDTQQLVGDRRTLLKNLQNPQKNHGILAARNADGNPVTVFDEPEITDGLAGQLANSVEGRETHRLFAPKPWKPSMDVGRLGSPAKNIVNRKTEYRPFCLGMERRDRREACRKKAWSQPAECSGLYKPA